MRYLKHPAFGRYIPLGRLADLNIAHPDRTMSRANGAGFASDYVVAEWPDRAAMMQFYHRQGQNHPPHYLDWHPWRREDR